MQKYYSCKYLQSGIHFQYQRVKPCCSIKEGPVFIENYKGEPINWDDIQRQRQQVKEIFKSGQIYEACKGCFELKEDYWEEKNYIDTLFFFHWTHCNCGCIYCVNKFLTKGEYSEEVKKSQYYDVLPILKDMSDKNLIGKNADIRCLGGESTVLEEFEPIIDLILENDPQIISFLTSGIKHSTAIEKAIKQNKALIVISIDSGCAETYKKIKRVDKFNDVIENIKKYLSYSKELVNYFTLKYILVEKVNDNIEELEKWLQLSSNLGIKNVRLDFDYSKILDRTQSNVPENYYDLFKYIKQRTNELNLNLESYEFIDELLEKKHYENNL